MGRKHVPRNMLHDLNKAVKGDDNVQFVRSIATLSPLRNLTDNQRLGYWFFAARHCALEVAKSMLVTRFIGGINAKSDQGTALHQTALSKRDDRECIRFANWLVISGIGTRITNEGEEGKRNALQWRPWDIERNNVGQFPYNSGPIPGRQARVHADILEPYEQCKLSGPLQQFNIPEFHWRPGTSDRHSGRLPEGCLGYYRHENNQGQNPSAKLLQKSCPDRLRPVFLKERQGNACNPLGKGHLCRLCHSRDYAHMPGHIPSRKRREAKALQEGQPWQNRPIPCSCRGNHSMSPKELWLLFTLST